MLKNKKLLIVLLFIIIYLSFGLYLNLTTTTHERLEEIGYSNIESTIIEDVLTKEEIQIVLKYPYHKKLTNYLLKEKYNSKQLEEYLKKEN